MTSSVLPVAGLLVCCFVGGCGSNDQTTSRDSEASETSQSVFDPMVETIDRAKQIEQLSEDRVRQLDQQLEEAEGDKQ